MTKNNKPKSWKVSSTFPTTSICTRGKGSLSSMLERPYSVYSGSPLSETRLRALLLRKAAVSSVLRDVFSFPFFSFLGIFVNVIDNI
jgi:hypothetical protein